jgi:hypothetical protein
MILYVQASSLRQAGGLPLALRAMAELAYTCVVTGLVSLTYGKALAY